MRQRNRVQKQCVVCGQSFEVIKSREHKAKACSKECRDKSVSITTMAKRATKTCPRCGSEFSVPPSHAGRRIYCSNACAEPARHANPAKGSALPGWKGGRAKRSDGYVYALRKGHPKATKVGYVLEHRLVLEDRMVREVPSHPFLETIDGWPVLRDDIDTHHLNEERDDNREANLVACTSAGHHAFHHGLSVALDEYWPHSVKPNRQDGVRIRRTCATCYMDFYVRPCDLKYNKAIYCSHTCVYNRSLIKR